MPLNKREKKTRFQDFSRLAQVENGNSWNRTKLLFKWQEKSKIQIQIRYQRAINLCLLNQRGESVKK